MVHLVEDHSVSLGSRCAYFNKGTVTAKHFFSSPTPNRHMGLMIANCHRLTYIKVSVYVFGIRVIKLLIRRLIAGRCFSTQLTMRYSTTVPTFLVPTSDFLASIALKTVETSSRTRPGGQPPFGLPLFQVLTSPVRIECQTPRVSFVIEVYKNIYRWNTHHWRIVGTGHTIK